MKKSPKIVMEISFTRDELWTLLNHFSGKTDVFIPVELSQKFVIGYSDFLALEEKQTEADNHIDHETETQKLKGVTDWPVSEQIVDSVWIEYLEIIKVSKNIQHYEPISYINFIKLLNRFVEEYAAFKAKNHKFTESKSASTEIFQQIVERIEILKIEQETDLNASGQAQTKTTRHPPGYSEGVLTGIQKAISAVLEFEKLQGK